MKLQDVQIGKARHQNHRPDAIDRKNKEFGEQ